MINENTRNRQKSKKKRYKILMTAFSVKKNPTNNNNKNPPDNRSYKKI